MKSDPASDLNDELRPEYETGFITGMLKNGVRGKYAGRITRIQGRVVTPALPIERVVVFSPDVAAAFPTDEAINNALRSVMASKAAESTTK